MTTSQMKVAIVHPIGRSAFRNHSPIKVDGEEIGVVMAHHAGSGWRGHDSSYHLELTPSWAKLLGHAQAFETQQALKEWVKKQMSNVPRSA